MLLQIQDFLLVQGRIIIVCVCVCVCVCVYHIFFIHSPPTNPEVGLLDNLVVVLCLIIVKCTIQWY